MTFDNYGLYFFPQVIIGVRWPDAVSWVNVIWINVLFKLE